MSLPRKGTKRISIGNDTFLYKESWDQMVLIKDSSTETQKLICVIPGDGNLFHIKSKENIGKLVDVYSYGRSSPVPKPFVREAIYSALAFGWLPTSTGCDFFLSIRPTEESHIYEFYCGKNRDLGITAVEKLCYNPWQDESLNRVVELGLELVGDWQAPVDARIKKYVPHMSERGIDDLNSMIADLREYGVEEICKCIKGSIGEKEMFKRLDSEKNQIKSLIKSRQPRLNVKNVNSIYSQCVTHAIR